ncbi:UNVERIFIED_CONTAM: hypothetical protein GTU68_056624, partial [Idotea baltica]|nr:hypothetical protein [Idotea baltica]
ARRPSGAEKWCRRKETACEGVLQIVLFRGRARRRNRFAGRFRVRTANRVGFAPRRSTRTRRNSTPDPKNSKPPYPALQRRSLESPTRFEPGRIRKPPDRLEFAPKILGRPPLGRALPSLITPIGHQILRRIPLERTLVLLKPDAVQRHLTGPILSRFEQKGLKLVGMKMRCFPGNDLSRLIRPPERPSPRTSSSSMTSGPVSRWPYDGKEPSPWCAALVGRDERTQAAPGRSAATSA